MDSTTSGFRDYITSGEAMRILRVRPQTLYAYVSRGLIRSVVQPGTRARLYLHEDVQRTSSRSAARAGHGAVAASAMNWGEPIISTAITEITARGPSYRGYLATTLTEPGRAPGFEAVAELLWKRKPAEERLSWPIAKSSGDMAQAGRRFFSSLSGGNLLESFAMVVLMLGIERGTVEDRVRQGETLAAARQIMQTLVGCCGFAGPHARHVPMKRGDTIVQGLLRALAIEATDENLLALEAILIVMADHELSPGTLSARVVASGGGTLHSCVAAALCANSGVHVGRGYELVEDFLGRARAGGALARKAERLVQQGKSVPGFAHPLYPRGDPRAARLLEIAASRAGQTAESRAVFSFIDTMSEHSNLRPSQELAIVLLTRMMGATRPVPTAVFALARTAGWVAHVIEQREHGTLLRPRALYRDDQAQLPSSG